jgi:hypothetical protein
MADALATLSFMFCVNHWNDVPIIKVQRLDRPAHVFVVENVPDQTDGDVNDGNLGITISNSSCRITNTHLVLPIGIKRLLDDGPVDSFWTEKSYTRGTMTWSC